MSTEGASDITEPNMSGFRPWPKGKSGNPHGRRAKGFATAERLRNALVKELPAILEVIVKNAKAGDLDAAKTILERVLPPLKATEMPVITGELIARSPNRALRFFSRCPRGRLPQDRLRNC